MSEEKQRLCQERYKDFVYDKNFTYCEPYNDSFLCWGPAVAGQISYKHCPAVRLSDPSRLAFRICSPSGSWLDKRQNDTTLGGWTNYTPCFEKEVNALLNKISDENASVKFEIAQNTRYLEIVGFSISLVALILSLLVYTQFRTLLNNRTRIHKNLFSAMVVQVLIRLVVYIDQELVNYQSIEANVTTIGLQNVPYLCECTYIILEYSMTSMFLWMFLEGLYLNKLVSGRAMKENISYTLYLFIGWGCSFVMTIIWSIVNGISYGNNVANKCWYGYNFKTIYWIVQGPRVAVMVTNFLFLVNILRVVLRKLKSSENSELTKASKALRAALVLLPLLGLTNILNMVHGPLEGKPWKFALWSYTTHFLRSFEGFFIALLYCFLNVEVQTVVQKYFENRRAIRETRLRCESYYRREQRILREAQQSSSNEPTHKTTSTQTKAKYRSLYRYPPQYANLPYSATLVSEPAYKVNGRCVGTDTASPLPRHPSAIIYARPSRLNIEYEIRSVVAAASYPLDAPCRSESRVWTIYDPDYTETRL